jgi:uncharacterized membrane protein
MASEREATVDRVIAFSDGTVAIAITLLVLPLTEIATSSLPTTSPVTPNSPMARQWLKAANMSWQVVSLSAHSLSPW